MDEPVAFSSECPNCGGDRVQFGFTRAELLELLGAGAEIRAYCSNCDEEWVVSTEERADISASVARQQKLTK